MLSDTVDMYVVISVISITLWVCTKGAAPVWAAVTLCGLVMFAIWLFKLLVILEVPSITAFSTNWSMSVISTVLCVWIKGAEPVWTYVTLWGLLLLSICAYAKSPTSLIRVVNLLVSVVTAEAIAISTSSLDAKPPSATKFPTA